MEKTKVAVLFGGTSKEREVALVSGRQVLENLNKEKFEPFAYDTKTDLEKLFSDIKAKRIDVCFIALHGKGGEDGVTQGFLECLGMPYCGPGVLASAIGMDKKIFKAVMKTNRIPVPFEFEETNIEYPCVVKPSASGSSVGVSIVENKEQFCQALAKAKEANEGEVLIEEYIRGREITVGVLGNNRPFALPIVEIRPKNKFFDYQAKYNAEFCEEIVPARIDLNATKKAEELGLKVYKILGCRGFSRIDMILKDNNDLVVLEINTIPGLTPNSLLPKAAQAAGIGFDELLEKIIAFALKRQ